MCTIPEGCNDKLYTKYHCQKHDILLKKSHKKYKTLQLKNITGESVEELLKEYNRLVEIHKLRLQHRQRFFRKEDWDFAHEDYLQQLYKSINNIEYTLEQIFNKNIESQSAIVEEIRMPQIDEENNCIMIYKQTKKRKEKQYKEEGWQDKINEIIKEDDKEIQQMAKYWGLLVRLINSFPNCNGILCTLVMYVLLMKNENFRKYDSVVFLKGTDALEMMDYMRLPSKDVKDLCEIVIKQDLIRKIKEHFNEGIFVVITTKNKYPLIYSGPFSEERACELKNIYGIKNLKMLIDEYDADIGCHGSVKKIVRVRSAN